MEVRFRDERLRRFVESEEQVTKRCGEDVARQLPKKLQQLMGADRLEDLFPYRGLRLELLVPKHAGIWSIRINRQWRLLFRVGERDDVIVVEEVSKHYER